MENKEMLEAAIKGLQEKVNSLNTDITTKQKKLEDLDKPELTQYQFDVISDAITDGIDNTSFEEGNFDWEPEFCGKEVQLNYLTFEGQEYLLESIQTAIESMFKIVEEEQESSFGND